MERQRITDKETRIACTNEWERRLIGRESIGVYDALAQSDLLFEDANVSNRQAISDYFSEMETGGADKFLKASQQKLLAKAVIFYAMPQDEELEQMFISAQIEEEFGIEEEPGNL